MKDWFSQIRASHNKKLDILRLAYTSKKLYFMA